MKNRVILSVLLLGITVLFSSCLDLLQNALDATINKNTFKIELDEHSFDDRNFTLTYDASLVLKRWNGSDVTKIIYDGKREIGKEDKIILSVPAGDTSFIFDVYIIFDETFSYTAYRVPNVEISYSLEAGKKYQLKTWSKKKEFFLGIYDVTKRSALLQEWKIGRR